MLSPGWDVDNCPRNHGSFARTHVNAAGSLSHNEIFLGFLIKTGRRPLAGLQSEGSDAATFAVGCRDSSDYFREG